MGKKDTIETIKQMVADGVLSQEIAEKYFDELKENEDERMRKWIINYLSNRILNSSIIAEKGILKKAIAWLEKKGEQKLADKVEPKFKVGDWITDGNITIQIEAIKNDCYLYCGDCTLYSTKTADKVYHLWTIQDAKAGDVLICGVDKRPFIFKGLLDTIHPNYPVAYCGINLERDFHISLRNHWWTNDDIQPATKEQCDLLFQKMKETGYEWDAEHKQLKNTPIFHIGDRVRYKGYACDGVITEITDADYICGHAKLPISTQDELELVK